MCAQTEQHIPMRGGCGIQFNLIHVQLLFEPPAMRLVRHIAQCKTTQRGFRNR